MRRQLQESIAPNGLSDYSIVTRIRRGRRQNRRWVRETGVRVKAGVQCKIAVRGIETRMVENVERVGLKFQGDTLRDLEILEKRQIESRLEWGAEDISSIGTVAGFLGITNGRAAESRAARRHATLTRLQERDGEIIRIDVRNPDPRKWPGPEGIVSSTLGRLMRRDSGSKRKNWVCNEVVGAEENAGRGPGKIDDAERLATLGHRDALDPPSVGRRIDEPVVAF